MGEMEFFNAAMVVMKFQNRCMVCGKILPIGSFAYIRQNSATDKWEFECHACYKSGEQANAIAAEMSTDEPTEALSTLYNVPSPVNKESAMTKIARAAKWRLSDV